MISSNSNTTLLLRISSFQHYDFIYEHQSIIERNGFVWMLKTGRAISPDVMERVLKCGGRLVLKTPKSAGGRYYQATFSEYRTGKPTATMPYPNYYKKILDDFGNNTLEGTWIKLTSILEAEEDYLNHMRLCSNNKKMLEVVGQTRTAVMYVYPESTNDC